MSKNISVRNHETRNKTQQKVNSKKRGNVSETETSTNSPAGTPSIVKYLTREPASKKAKTSDDTTSSVTENSRPSRVEKTKQVPKDTETASNTKNGATSSKTSPSSVAEVDNSGSDCPTEHNSGKPERDLLNTDTKDKCKGKIQSTDKKEQQSEKGDNCVQAEQTETENENEGNGDRSDSKEDDDHSTLEYKLNSLEEARAFVEYKEEDFNTDSDFENYDSDNKERRDQLEKEDSVLSSRHPTKRPNKAMGNSWCRTKAAKTETYSPSPRKETCQGSSSEDDSDRPWRERSTRKKPRKDYSPYGGASRLAPLKRQWSDHDTKMYRDGYPDKKDVKSADLNLKFYTGKMRSRPDGAYIDDFHKGWWHDHERLERQHGYIQWLFPIRESGMNWQAQELQLHEAKAIQADPQAMTRFVKSYKMMLYFYGIQLVSEDTGEVKRAANWESRFKHLNSSMHNYLRITRILKSLGEMGLERFKAPFLRFMLHEAIETRKLDRTLDSCYNYWIGTLRDDDVRKRVQDQADDMLKNSRSRL